MDSAETTRPPYRPNIGRILTITAAFIVFAILYETFVINEILPRMYVGTAQVQVVRANLGGTPQSGIGYARLNSEIDFLRSKDFQWPVVDELRLDKIWAKRVYKSSLDALPKENALGYFNEHLAFGARSTSSTITINFTSQVPEEASHVANAIADRYYVLRLIGNSASKPVIKFQGLSLADPYQSPPSATASRRNSELAVTVITRAEIPKKATWMWLEYTYRIALGIVIGTWLGFLVAAVIEWVEWYLPTAHARAKARPGTAKASEKY